MNKLKIRNSLLLFLTACIWGSAFVAQSVGMKYIEPFTFSATRNIIGFLFLLVYLFVRQLAKKNGDQKTETVHPEDKRNLLLGGIFCGAILFVASNLQQYGLIEASPGKAGFITALYIVLVPVIGIFQKKRHGKKLWISVILALGGLYLLCVKPGNFSLTGGDLMLVLCALIFSIHILVIDHYTELVDGVKMSCIQFLVCGILSAVGMLIVDHPTMAGILLAAKPILYAGICSSGIAYTLQIVGQKGVNPVVASLIMSLESVVAVLAGWLILGDVLTGRELAGCVIMFLAIILAQLPDNLRRKLS